MQTPQNASLREKLKAGQAALGVWTIIPSPMHVEIMGSAGFDFQILDLEHGALDFGTLDACVRACEGAGCSPWVRVPEINPSIAQRALDTGAHGLVYPQVKGYEGALQAVQCSLFAPDGVRGFNPFTRAGHYLVPGKGPNKLQNEFPLISIIIENERSYQELDQILTIPRIDVVYLGVYDMSVVLGCMGDLQNPKIVSFLETSIAKIKKAGKAAGVMAKNRAEMDYFLKLGANVLVHGVDTNLIASTVLDARKNFDQARGL